MHQQITLSEMFRSYEQDYKAHMESVMYDILKLSKNTREESDNNLTRVQDELH